MPATLAADALTSLEATVAFLGIEPEDVTDRLEDVLVRLINSASGYVRDTAEREFVTTLGNGGVGTRRFDYDGTRILRIDPFDLRVDTDLEIVIDPGGSPTTLAANEFRPKPTAAPHGVYDRIMLANEYPVGPIGGVVAVTGTWGFPVVPDEIVDAVHRIIDSVFDRDLAVASEAFDDVPTSLDTVRVPFDVIDTCTRWQRGIAALGV
jgi:hypothetical protein